MPNYRVIHNGPPKRRAIKMQQPQEGFTTKAKVTRVIDGDTVDVEITRKVRVRLKDCWAPEKKSRDIVEKQKGMASLAHLAAVIDDKEIVLFIPADDKGEIKDVFTFGRVVGHIFYNEEDMSEHMIESGHATRYKVK